MFRMWAKLWKENRLMLDKVIEDGSSQSRTKKIFGAMESLCQEWDLPMPLWLPSQIGEFGQSSRTRFGQDSFVEDFPYDYLEIHMLEED